MSLDSVFLVFCFVFIFCFFLSSGRRKWAFITGNILFLFAMNGIFASVFLVLGILNFFLEKEKYFSLLVFLNVSFLVLFKYLLPQTEWFSYKVLWPLGLSVVIFQQLAFIFDRKRKPEMAQLTLGDFFLYSFLFNSLVTGPLSRLTELEKEKKHHLLFSTGNILKGFVLISLGLFQKLVIADNIALLTTPMLNPAEAPAGYDITLAFLLNKYEIFANFSGFTDVALGSAMVFGFHLPVNFNRPFRIPSIVEFWKRWHMSLSGWIRDYVFFPLSVSPLGKAGVVPLLFLTFTIFALWHDFKMTFVLYGWLQVLFILCSRFFVIPFFPLRWIFFYVILLSIPSILFRVPDIGQFLEVMKKLASFSPMALLSTVLIYKYALMRIAAGIFIYESFIHFLGVEKFSEWFRTTGFFRRFLIFCGFLFLMLILCAFESGTQFIYSRF